jgi:hypothetical protein
MAGDRLNRSWCLSSEQRIFLLESNVIISAIRLYQEWTKSDAVRRSGAYKGHFA